MEGARRGRAWAVEDAPRELRSSHQIRQQADRLLAPEVVDADGNAEERRHTVSVFNGPPSETGTFPSPEEETAGVAAWIRAVLAEGLLPHEVGGS